MDTTRAEVARAALEAGADLVNDVSGFRFDPAMAPLVAEKKVPAVVMHSRGSGYAQMHRDPTFIAQALELPVSTVKTRLYRGLGQLRLRLETDELIDMFSRDEAPEAAAALETGPGAAAAEAVPEELSELDRLPPPSLYYGLDGTVSLVRKRFLHLYIDIQQREIALHPLPIAQEGLSLFAGPTGAEGAPPPDQASATASSSGRSGTNHSASRASCVENGRKTRVLATLKMVWALATWRGVSSASRSMPWSSG